MGAPGTLGIAAVMAVGLVGTVVPFLPGLAVVWGAGLVYGIVDGFGVAGVVAFAIMTVLLLVGSIASYLLPHRAGRVAGADRASLRLGILLAVVGFFVIPVIGLVLGGVGGVFLGEYRRSGDAAAAWHATKRVLLGFGQGLLVEVGAGVAMVLTWVIWVIVG